MDADDIESSEPLKMPTKDLHRFETASKEIQEVCCCSKQVWAYLAFATPTVLLLFWQGRSFFPTLGEQKQFTCYMVLICTQSFSVLNLFRDHKTIDAIEEMILRNLKNVNLKFNGSGLEDIVATDPERLVLDEVDIAWITSAHYGDSGFDFHLIMFVLIYGVILAEIFFSSNVYAWEWRVFALVETTWIAYASCICGRVLRDSEDVRLWSALPKKDQIEKLEYMLTLCTHHDTAFRVMTSMCSFGGSVTTIYFLFVWELDPYDRLLYLVGYVFSVQTSVTLSKLIRDRVVARNRTYSVVQAQRDIFFFSSLGMAIAMLFAYVGYGESLATPNRFLLGASSSLGFVASLGPGLAHQTEEINPTDFFREEARRHPPSVGRVDRGTPARSRPAEKGGFIQHLKPKWMSRKRTVEEASATPAAEADAPTPPRVLTV